MSATRARDALRSPLRVVLGHGAAGEGVRHWWLQRMTALALVPLTLWFAFSLLALPRLNHGIVSRWIGTGATPLLLALLVVALAWHSKLGVQVVIEDYLHGKATRIAALIASGGLHIVAVAAALLAIVRIAARGLG